MHIKLIKLIYFLIESDITDIKFYQCSLLNIFIIYIIDFIFIIYFIDFNSYIHIFYNFLIINYNFLIKLAFFHII